MEQLGHKQLIGSAFSLLAGCALVWGCQAADQLNTNGTFSDAVIGYPDCKFGSGAFENPTNKVSCSGMNERCSVGPWGADFEESGPHLACLRKCGGLARIQCMSGSPAGENFEMRWCTRFTCASGPAQGSNCRGITTRTVVEWYTLPNGRSGCSFHEKKGTNFTRNNGQESCLILDQGEQDGRCYQELRCHKVRCS